MIEALYLKDKTRWAPGVLYDGIVSFEHYSNSWWNELYAFVREGYLRQSEVGKADPRILRDGQIIGGIVIPKVTKDGAVYTTRFELGLSGDQRHLKPREVWLGDSIRGVVDRMDYQIVFPDDASSEITQWFFTMESATPFGGVYRVRILE